MKQDISYIRVYAILTLVLWHCFFCPYLCWDLVEPSRIPVLGIYNAISTLFIPDASMPLFTFVSGYLFYYLYSEKGKYHDGKKFIWKKTKRLVIPFFVLGTVIMLTTFPRYNSDILWGWGSHLWYAMMLFWCFVFSWLLKRLNNRKVELSFVLLGCAFILVNRGSTWMLEAKLRLPLGIHHAIYYFPYFYMGGIIYKYRLKIFKSLLEKEKIICIMLLYICMYFCACIINDKYVYIIDKIIRSFLFPIILFLFINYIERKGAILESKLVNNIEKCGFGIYVFHHWIAWNVVHMPNVPILLEKHYILFPIVFSILIFIASYVLTNISLKTKVGNFLLAG